MRTRAALLAAGVVVGGYGGFRLLELGGDNLIATLVWLTGGLLLHDAVLVPVTIVLTAVGGTVLPRHVRGPAAAGAVVLGTVTLSSVPVLGRFGARADNPTLLDRDYAAVWLALAAAVLLAVAVGSALSAVSARRNRAEEG